ncbi:hypothetical protein DV736_g2872, partial [Chaetothyriales sp. CBS 134916]
MSASAPLGGASKPIHTIILDSSPLLLNTPGISTLLTSGHVLVTTPSVLAEIKTEEAKSRVETLYKPFLELRSPKPDSVAFVRAFAGKTGDAGVLSQTDFEVLALAYELECERNGGDWRLRNAPGQKRLNGSRPEKAEEDEERGAALEAAKDVTEDMKRVRIDQEPGGGEKPHQERGQDQPKQQSNECIEGDVSEQRIPELLEEQDSADSDDGWITPSNIKRRQARDEAADNAANARGPTKMLQVATMTGDFAMQNVLLQINLNLLSTKTCQRISQIKQFVLRCHACFTTCKDMSKQFCPRCGKPTLTRVSCTTNDKGEVKLHLKAKMQWNNRGNVYSIPKPITGSANQKWKGPSQGGGKGGWGSDLILAEDQKEYIRAVSGAKRSKAKDLMDEDTLPNILTGERDRAGGRPRVGAGRNVNSRKR